MRQKSCCYTNDAEEVQSEDEYEEKTQDTLKVLTAFVVSRFDRVICDEAHKVKDPHTRAARAFKLMGARRLWLLTATPIMNKVGDLTGLLLLFWKDWFSNTNLEPILTDFERAPIASFSPATLTDNVYFLNPGFFKSVALPCEGGQNNHKET